MPPKAATTPWPAPQFRRNPVDGMRPDAPTLAAFGPHPVGVRQMGFTNPDQIDMLASDQTTLHRKDRALKVELWYPAAAGTQPGTTYDTHIRDGHTVTTLSGRSARDATPATGITCPLVILSHGYPGNRFLLSHLGENLASKGYVVASIDHTDSLYQDMGAFHSTLYHRPRDQRFVLDRMADLAPIAPDIAAILDASRCAVIGYSMGGYGALVFGGMGLSQAAVDTGWNVPQGLLATHLAGSHDHAALIDPRVKAVVTFGPWGANNAFWDAAGLAGLRKPLLVIAGSCDDTSGYDAMRQIFTGATGTTRHLLTFLNAGHNAGAPIPAPDESWAASPHLDFVPFAHYGDAVWDTTRMNNIAQHVTTAFLGQHLLQDSALAAHLAPDLPGFAPGTAQGLTFETLPAP